MIFDNDNYTERQREIITKIGAENRERLAKDLKRVYLIFIAPLVFFGLVAIGLFFLDPSYLLTIFIFMIIGGISFFAQASNKKKILTDLHAREDYYVGLYYADRDPRVKGNTAKTYRKVKLSSLIAGSLLVVIGALILFFTSTSEPQEYTGFISISGVIEDGYESDDDIVIDLEDSDIDYKIMSNYTYAMNVDHFFDHVYIGDTVNMLVEPFEEDDTTRWVYYLEANGTVYLDEDIMLAGWEHNNTIGMIVGAFLLVIGIGFLAALPIYKYAIYNKIIDQEKYDLDFTDHELQSMAYEQDEQMVDPFDTDDKKEKIYVKTSPPKWMGIFFVIFFGIAVVGGILGVILIPDADGKIAIAIIGGMFGLIGGFGLYAMKNEYEILDGDTVLVKRVFRKIKTYQAKDIKTVAWVNQYIMFYDRNSKVLFKASSMTKDIAKIIAELAKYGAMLQRNF